MSRLFITTLAAVAALAGPAGAAVIDRQPNGFEVATTVHIDAPPAKVYAALVHIGRWWASAHSFSHDAANLSIDPVAGGCFCERLAGGGSVAFGRVIYVAPDALLRLQTALGPLQSTGADGHLTFALVAKDGGTDLTETYDVGGYAKGGLDGWAATVDRVLGEQMARLKQFVETGAP